MHKKLIVITGSSGVGKSTLALALQEELLPDQWIHFSVDTLFYCLPRSTVLRVDQQNEHSLVDSKAIIAGAHACAATLLRLGNKVIFDAVILSAKGANELLEAFADFDPVYVELTCSWLEIERRTMLRSDRTIEEAAHGHKHSNGHFHSHHSFDTTNTSAANISKELISRLCQ